MNAMSSKRDAAYYRRRLRAEYPAIYADLRAGRIKSTRQAAIAAGLVKAPTRADALIREWKKATPSHRKRFFDWLKTEKVGLKKTTAAIADADGRLSPPAVTFLKKYLDERDMRPGGIMLAMGFNRYDWRLASALKGDLLPTEVVEALKKWMPVNGYG
jgi:hypothetical protein